MGFKSDMQQSVGDFFEKCLAAVGILYSPENRHADIADVEQYYMSNGYFWCLFDNEVLVGTVAVRTIDTENKVVELKRLFVTPEYQGQGYGKFLLNHAIEYAKKQNYILNLFYKLHCVAVKFININFLCNHPHQFPVDL